MRPITLLHWRVNKISLSLLFEVRDLWIGIYWDKAPEVMSTPLRHSIYICIIPMLPIVIRTYVCKPDGTQ